MNRRTLLLMLSLGLAAVVAGAVLARMLGSSPVLLETGTWLPRARPIEDFHLQDLAGRDFSPANLQGHPTLLFFGFTHCPDVCPTTLATLAQVQRAAPLPDTEVLFVSIDPERDSAEQLRVYLGYFDPQFQGVRGSPAALAPLLHSLSAIAERESLPDGGYTMDHSATLYLLDTHGRLVAVFSPPFVAARLVGDLRQLAATHRL